MSEIQKLDKIKNLVELKFSEIGELVGLWWLGGIDDLAGLMTWLDWIWTGGIIDDLAEMDFVPSWSKAHWKFIEMVGSLPEIAQKNDNPKFTLFQ